MPALGVGALGGGAVVLGQEGAGCALGLQHDFVFLLQLLFEETHWLILAFTGAHALAVRLRTIVLKV